MRRKFTRQGLALPSTAKCHERWLRSIAWLGGEVAGHVLVHDGVVVGVGVPGELLALEMDVAVGIDVVVVVPLGAPQFGQSVALVIEAGEGHHAVQGEVVRCVKTHIGIGGVETVAAQPHGSVMLTGVELAQVQDVDYCVVLVDGGEVDIETVWVFTCRQLVGHECDVVVDGTHADELSAVGYVALGTLGKAGALLLAQ